MLPMELKHLRHVRILMMDSFGHPTVISSGAEAVRDLNSAPAWFAYLVRPHTAQRRVRIVSVDHVSPLLIIGEPADEIAEHWENFRWLALVWVALELIILLVLAIVLGRILNPLKSLAGGMIRLEDGDYSTRLDQPKVRELAVLTDRFNALAEVLELARNENSYLNRQLISLQETERKEIANELHDEAGPCLFGISANASSIKTAASRLGDGDLSEIAARADQILKIGERLKQTNRSLLRKLAPVSHGHVGLVDLINELISSFEHAHPGTTFVTELGTLANTYGEGVDLTLYRALQEGITNSIQHGGASKLKVRLSERLTRFKGQAKTPTLLFVLEDNGNGMVDSTRRGFGLTTMFERVRSLEGKCEIVGTPTEGASLTIRIPLTKIAPVEAALAECAA